MIAALTALLGLSGCGADSIPFYTAPIVLSCPDYAILEDAATLTAFQDGPGRDITDVTVRAEITQVRMECITDVDSDTNTGHMEIKIIPIIAAEMGRRQRRRRCDLALFHCHHWSGQRNSISRRPIDGRVVQE